MAIRRVALIFDSVQRPETTGVYCLRALRQFVEVEHFRPGELEQIRREGFALCRGGGLPGARNREFGRWRAEPAQGVCLADVRLDANGFNNIQSGDLRV